ncbi:MAG: hypothetical protein KGH64_00525 [Candidatus Micrarchaeota archaeon]|nr:hypothetical protein [Candidatus Micrarchaeota archaeon]MDE1833801.1 hypothetical protein [Candidatus Micrarchaeota archaeon]MDE1859589.1 hypothetical protein [Candidatus Micrarchaeota archaeon]
MATTRRDVPHLREIKQREDGLVAALFNLRKKRLDTYGKVEEIKGPIRR